MYPNGGEQERAEAQAKRKRERDIIRSQFVAGEPASIEFIPEANLALLLQALELLESINTKLGSLGATAAKIELKADMIIRTLDRDRTGPMGGL